MHTKPKKSLGQNFLIDNNIRNKIITACAFNPNELVLEIGSGKGELTALIAAQGIKKLFAVEIDKRLHPILADKLILYKNCNIIKTDILKFELRDFLSKKANQQKIKVVGNIPYYISTPIIEYLIKNRDLIEEVFMTVQKEFAKRLVAQPGSKDFGSLSCFVQYYFEPKIVFDIKRNSFFPVPKVDSVFLKLKPRISPKVKVCNQDLFFKVIRAAFNQRRKILRNSLQGFVPEELLNYFFANSKLNRNIRPEDLSLEDFACLSNLLEKN